VAGEDDRHPGARPFAQDLAEDVDADGVEAGERLVEHEELGVVDERRAELRPLLVAERQRLRAAVGDVGEPEAVEPPRRRGARRFRAEPVQAGEVHELVGDPHLRVQPALLGHVAEPRAGRGVERPALPAHGVLVGLEHAEDDPHRRGLARAVGPDEAEQLTRTDVEAQPVERDRGAVATAQVVELEDGGAQAGSPTQYSTAPAMRPSWRS
jgi:hypothetical protein